MIKKKLIVNNKTGLHARPASMFVETADKFEAEIEIKANGMSVNGKSIIGVLSLGVGKGDKITLIIDGKDEEEAIKALEKLINNNFGDY